VSFSDFLIQVPPEVRLLLALVISIGVSLAFVWVFHDKMLRLDDKNLEAAEKAVAEEGVDPSAPRAAKNPDTMWLAQRVLGLTATGFVFLLAFTIGNCWGNHSDARSATIDEAMMYARAAAIVETIPADQGGTQLTAAMEKYRHDLNEVQWPLLQRADSAGAYAVQSEASGAIGKATVAASRAGASKLPGWNLLTDSLNSMTSDATMRISQLPGSNVPGILWVIAILGLANLVMTAAFQPARRGPNLLLIGVMAGITSLLMFLVVEATNPFIGGGAVSIPILG
jgi:hypothetical protein